MITQQDITKLRTVFVTKDEFTPFKDEMYEFKTEMTEFKEEMLEFREEMADFRVNTAERLENVEGKIDTLLVMTDALLGTYKDSMDEHRAGAHILARHDRQLTTLAKGTGITLPD